MTTNLITFKVDSTFLKEIDRTSHKAGFHSRTEFIRNALIEKINRINLNQAIIELASIFFLFCFHFH